MPKWRIGKEIIEAANPMAARRMLAEEGKVSHTAQIMKHEEQAKNGTAIMGNEVEPVANEAATANRGIVDTIGHALGTPQRKMFNGIAAVSGVPYNAENTDDTIHNLVQAGGDAIGLPNNTLGSALKAGAVAGASVFADPVNLIPIGKAVEGLGKLAPAIGPAANMLGEMSHARMPGYADGGEVLGAVIPDAEVGYVPPTHIPTLGSNVPTSGTMPVSDDSSLGAVIPDEQVNFNPEKYESLGQQAITGLEGAATGVIGPLAPLAEKALGVPEEDILNRQITHPITHGVGQAVGLGGSMLTGVGEGALMAKAGQLAAEAAMGAKVAEGASLGFKVGSEAVKQAAEMAVLQGSDEVSKMVLHDPDTSAESAIGHIGLSAALGGTGGALIAGTISPLWEATAGPGIEKALGHIRGHLDGSIRTAMPEATQQALTALGVDAEPILKAVLSGNKEAIEHFTTLKYAQEPKVLEAIEKLQNDVSNSVMNSLGVPLDEMKVHSKAEAGEALEKTFIDEFKTMKEPMDAAFTKRNAEAATIGTTDTDRMAKYGQIIEKGMKEVGTDSPSYALYDHWGNRLLAKETIGGVDMLKTELGNDIEKAVRAADYNTANALKNIRNEFADFQEAQIVKAGREAGEGMVSGGAEGTIGADVAKLAGREEGAARAAELLNERANLNRQYAEHAKMSNELLDHLGLGNFKGNATLLRKIESVGPEGILKKFSVKGNADFIPFLAEHFPNTLAQVQKNELKDLIQPAVNKAVGENPINIKTLSDILKKTLAGKKELAEFSLSPEAMSKIDAATKIMDAIPKTKDSGTPGGLAKLLSKMPASAMAAVGMLTGHNPIAGALVGELAHKLGRNAPDAIRLGYLNFLGSNQPIKAAGFSAMVDFIRASAKGETTLVKAIGNVFKAGASVIPSHAYPTAQDNERLDKQVTKYQKAPTSLLELTNGNVGHYMPSHQTALAASATRAIQYLQSIKPQPHKIGPLDKEVPPQPSEVARYNRALSIANNPQIVLDHVKHGTLLKSDIQDLGSMYPALYKQMSTKLTHQMISAHSDEETIPYKTRIGTSLFLGTPVDASMNPLSIQAAQPKPQPMGQQQAGGQGGNSHRKGSTAKLGSHTTKSYLTPSQSAEADRSGRD